MLARFEAERQALALMDHRNIARVLDAGLGPQQRPSFVMEYVAGVPITDYCDRHRLRNAERLQIFLQVCAALQHAHQKGIIHRDLKPSNILVTVLDGKPVPKVIDFGIAKATRQGSVAHAAFTQLGMRIGTPEYISPEQAEANGLEVDTTTDLYSLGVVLYELLIGVLPFDGETLRRAGYLEMHRIIREQDPPKPSLRKTFALAEEMRAAVKTDPTLDSELKEAALRAITSAGDSPFDLNEAAWGVAKTVVSAATIVAMPGAAEGWFSKLPRRRREEHGTMAGDGTAVLFCVMIPVVAAAQAPSSGELARPSGVQRVVSGQLGASVTEPGLRNILELSWTRPLYRSRDPLLADAHLSAGLVSLTTPSEARPGGWVEYSPLSVLDIRAGLEPAVYFGTYKSLLSFAAYSDPYDRETRDARDDSTSGTGSRAYVAPVLKMKIGKLVARAGAEFERWSSSAAGPLFCEPLRDTLLKTDGDYLMTMTTVAMYQHQDRSGDLLSGGVISDMTDAIDAMVTRGLQIQKLTPQAEQEWQPMAERLYPKIRGTLVPADLFDDVTRISRRGDSLRNGAIAGAVFGAVGDALAMGFVDDSAGKKALGFLASTGFYALVGAGIDALIPGRTTIYQAWPAAKTGTPRPSAQRGLPGRIGGAFTVTW